MSMFEKDKIEQFQQILHQNLKNLGKERQRLKWYYNSLFWVALSAGASGTLLAGLATLSQGKILLGSGTEGWKLTCGLIGVLSLIATVASSFQQNIWIKDKFWKIEDSYGILKSLLTEIQLDPSQYAAVRRDYHRVVQRHPDLMN